MTEKGSCNCRKRGMRCTDMCGCLSCLNNLSSIPSEDVVDMEDIESSDEEL